MGAGGGNLQPAASGHRRQFAPQSDDLLARVPHIATDISAKFDDRLMHLGLDLFLQRHGPFPEDLLDVRTQLACLRVDDLELLLDPESKDVTGRVHARTTTTANSRGD